MASLSLSSSAGGGSFLCFSSWRSISPSPGLELNCWTALPLVAFLRVQTLLSSFSWRILLLIIELFLGQFLMGLLDFPLVVFHHGCQSLLLPLQQLEFCFLLHPFHDQLTLLLFQLYVWSFLACSLASSLRRCTRFPLVCRVSPFISSSRCWTAVS